MGSNPRKVTEENLTMLAGSEAMGYVGSGVIILNWDFLGVELLLELEIACRYVLQLHSLLGVVLSAAWIDASQIPASTDGQPAALLRAHGIRVGAHCLRHSFHWGATGCLPVELFKKPTTCSFLSVSTCKLTLHLACMCT